MGSRSSLKRTAVETIKFPIAVVRGQSLDQSSVERPNFQSTLVNKLLKQLKPVTFLTGHSVHGLQQTFIPATSRKYILYLKPVLTIV